VVRVLDLVAKDTGPDFRMPTNIHGFGLPFQKALVNTLSYKMPLAWIEVKISYR
jgi:hypothetical protein